jgi:hypothetical protein
MNFFTLRFLLKLAAEHYDNSALRRIETFGIKDPFVKFFVLHRDRIIPWAGYEINVKDPNDPEGEAKAITVRIKPENKEQDINDWISRIALPQLYRKVDISKVDYEKGADGKAKPDGTLFRQEIDMQKHLDDFIKKLKKQTDDEEIRKQFDDPQFAFERIKEIDADFARAYTVFLQDPIAGEKQYLTLKNKTKKAGYDTWIEFFKEHPLFDKNPAFVYTLLDKMLGTSGKTHSIQFYQQTLLLLVRCLILCVMLIWMKKIC